MFDPETRDFPHIVREELLAFAEFHNIQSGSTPQSETVRSANGNNITTYTIGHTSVEHLSAFTTSYSGRAVYYNNDAVYMREDRHEVIVPEPGEQLGIFAAIDPKELALFGTFEVVQTWTYRTELKRRNLDRFVGAKVLGKIDRHTQGKELLTLPAERLSKEEQISFGNSNPEDRGTKDNPREESERRKVARVLIPDARAQIDRGHIVNIFTALRWRIRDDRLLVPEVPDDPRKRRDL